MCLDVFDVLCSEVHVCYLVDLHHVHGVGTGGVTHYAYKLGPIEMTKVGAGSLLLRDRGCAAVGHGALRGTRWTCHPASTQTL